MLPRGWKLSSKESNVKKMLVYAVSKIITYKSNVLVQHGVKHIWVSNHGGRQLPDVRSTIEILPEIVQAVKGTHTKVYVDGGIRYGFDVFKCLALGKQLISEILI